MRGAAPASCGVAPWKLFEIGETNMDGSKRRALQFLQKEIKTYKALALFFSRKHIKQRVRLIPNSRITTPEYFHQRIEEALELVNEIRSAL